MIIFPAIDIKDGKCVRLYQGKIDKETVYSDDPVIIAKKWESKGAKFLHVVDLDGAFTGESKNRETVKKILEEVNIPVQLGGGIRSIDKAKDYIELGVERIIVGTSAVKEDGFVEELVNLFGERAAVSIDAENGFVCIDGWEKSSNMESVEFAKDLEAKGIKTIIYTDISKDGTMVGPNIRELRRLKDNVNINIIASGGIGSKEDVEKLKELNVYGAITGKALYEERIKLEEL